MEREAVTVNVIIDDKIFYKFSMFESFYKRRAYLPPLIFASILTVSAVLCLMMGSVPLGAVMLGIGLGLPAFRISRILRSIKAQIILFDLKNPKKVYSLQFTDAPDGIVVTNHGEGDEPLVYEWSKIHDAYRVKGCTYLYVLPEKAYLLPDTQVEEGPEALWELFSKMLPREKLHR